MADHASIAHYTRPAHARVSSKICHGRETGDPKLRPKISTGQTMGRILPSPTPPLKLQPHHQQTVSGASLIKPHTPQYDTGRAPFPTPT
ncbi:hypothetical protein N658DRAFT_57606 [Parathielavia hyrcaniae]|uniref:Uncharacterized protein n=1 Tax=Parathielavia hyrcaniae TaxID=113614 RepID=A0AAN6Q224_9PEZI|nr:hypothetical protein N658DRAFT_57606 [Parathielavia hyrcaniae]